MDVVDVLGALAMRERGVEDHDGAAVHDEADLASERAVEPLGEIGEDSCEELARERDFVHFLEYRERRGCHEVGFGGIAHHFWKSERDGERKVRQRVMVEGGSDGVKAVAW